MLEFMTWQHAAGGVKNATLRFDLPPPAVAVRNLVRFGFGSAGVVREPMQLCVCLC